MRTVPWTTTMRVTMWSWPCDQYVHIGSAPERYLSCTPGSHGLAGPRSLERKALRGLAHRLEERLAAVAREDRPRPNSSAVGQPPGRVGGEHEVEVLGPIECGGDQHAHRHALGLERQLPARGFAGIDRGRAA